MAQDAMAGPAAGGGSRALVVALCFAVAVLEGYDIQAVGVVARKLARALELHPDQMGWIFSISNVGLVLGATAGGWLADKFGRKPVFVASVLTFGLFTLATAAATDFNTIFAARFLAGLGFGGAIPNMMAVAAEISPPERRASTAAAMFCGMPMGGATSALFTANMPPDFDWRIVFIIGGVLPLLVAPLIWFKLPETRAEAAGPVNRNVFFALFGEGRAAPTLLLWLAFLPTLLILYLLLNWLPTLIVDKGFSEAVSPQASLAFNAASVVGALLFGNLVDRGGTRWPFAAAYILLIGTLIWLGQATSWVLVLALAGAAGFFLLGAQYALYGIAASYYPASVRGTGSGWSTAIGRVGSIIGPLAAGFLLNTGMTASNVFVLLAPAAALAGAAVFVLSFFKRAD